ncbi:hypothetical protein C8F04DRAFT_1124359 [Mycena alexandri]|uniref:Uncharacterized protein n=1 Tax=Mycena alexandri TaxID=1745969 RepID=A0AAD6SH51_9AGAR|nr:hypothetical protein C8F04DRAFT_1124359 [Mycena alexandri]
MEPGAYAVCWKTTRGEDWYEDGCMGPAYARLARFIKSVATKGGYTTRTVFGPGASFFSTSPSGYCWQNLPMALEDDIHSCMKTRRPISVALGVQGSYVVLYNDGTVTFDLRGQYPLVENMIRNTQEAARRRGVMYVALNPFVAGEFYAVYGDASASWNFPTAWSADVTAISREIKPMPSPAAAPAVAPGGTATQPLPPIPPVEVSPGGTAPSPAPLAPASTGGTVSSIASAVGHAISTVTQEAALEPPAYVPFAPQHVAPQAPTQSPPASAPDTPPAHKINWQQGLSMGLKAAQGINKIINVLDQGQGQQGSDMQPDSQNTFDFGNVQAGLQMLDQITVQQTTFDNGQATSVIDTTTTWVN